MTKDLMPTDLPEHPRELGVVSRVMSLNDTAKTIVVVTFARADGQPPPDPWRQEFPSRPVAQEYAQSLAPNPHETGSPLQNRLKRAKLLRIEPELLDLVTFTVSFEESQPDVPARSASRSARVRPTVKPAVSGKLVDALTDDDIAELGRDDNEPAGTDSGEPSPSAPTNRPDGPIPPDRLDIQPGPDEPQGGGLDLLGTLLSGEET